MAEAPDPDPASERPLDRVDRGAASAERSGPRLDLKVGFSCNNRCIFCVQGDKREHIGDQPTDKLKAILEEHRAASAGVVFTGGEATLRSDIIELVAHARSLGYETIQLQTNGRRLSYLPFFRALVKAGATEVSPALHGSLPAIHDRLTRSPGAFGQVLQGIRNARQLGVPVITNSVVVRDNVRDLPRLAQLLAGLSVQQIQFAYVHPAGTAEQHFGQVVARFSEAMPFVRKALEVVRAAGIRGFTEAVPYCFMRGFEEHVVEGQIPDTCVVDGPMQIDDYTAYRWTEGKAKGPPCERCTFARVCEGPWNEYPREYGWDEFEPRADDPRDFPSQ